MALYIGSLLVPTELEEVFQTNYLHKDVRMQNVPNCLFRQDAERRPFPAQVGQKMWITSKGPLAPIKTPTKHGITAAELDAMAAANQMPFEQVPVVVENWCNPADVNRKFSRASITDLFIETIESLAVNAGQSTNYGARDGYFDNYWAGYDITSAAQGDAGSTTVPLDEGSCKGFKFAVIQTGKRIDDVSASNPLNIHIGATAAQVTGFDVANKRLTLAVAKTWSKGATVTADNRPGIIFAGGAVDHRAITGSSLLQLKYIKSAVAYLRNQGRRPFKDGTYHVYHDSISAGQLGQDPQFVASILTQQLNPYWTDFEVYKHSGCTWITEEQCPTADGNDCTVHSVLVVADDSLVELYIPQAETIEGGQPLAGEIGELQWANSDGFKMITDGVAYIARPPLDRKLSEWGFMWDFDCGWAAKSAVTIPGIRGFNGLDVGSGRENAPFKNCVVILHGA